MTTQITIDLRCTACPATFYSTMDRDEATYEQRWDCETCGGQTCVRRVPSSPRVLRKSLLDGNGRFADLRKASKIEMESMDLPASERGEHKAEIAKLTKI